MIDGHRVAKRHIELIEYERFVEMPGQLGVTIHYGYLTPTATFVRRLKLIGDAEQESGHQVDGKRTGMVVVNNQHDIRLGLRHPLSSSFVAAKQRFPIGLTGLAMVDGRTNGGNMRRRDAADNFNHHGSPKRWARREDFLLGPCRPSA